MKNEKSPKVRCRQICDDDLVTVTDLLVQGFPATDSEHWRRGFGRISQRDAINNYPKYGYVLEVDAKIVGVILLIFSIRASGETQYTLCNFSSWYVVREYRSYGAWLVSTALRHVDATYINISASRHTWRTIEAQGFRRYTDGMILSFPALGRPVPRVSIEAFDPARDYHNILSEAEYDLLAAHVDYGCVALIAMEDGSGRPFVFVPRRALRGVIPNHQLCYCREIADFARLSGPLGRALMKQGVFFILVEANGPLPGLPGRYFPGLRPGYFKGPHEPAIGDLAFTEAVFFGL